MSTIDLVTLNGVSLYLTPMEDLKKRQGLSREIAYRPHVRAAYYVGWAITLLTIWPLARAILSLKMSDQPLMFVFAFLGFNAIAVGSLFLALYFIYRLAFKKFNVRPDRLEIFFSGKLLETVSFADVEGIKFAHVPLLIGMFTLKCKNGKEHMFTMAIERSEYVLDAIYNQRPEIFNIEELKNYRLNSIIMDHSAHRLEKRAKNWRRLLLKFVAYPILLTIVYVAARYLAGDKIDLNRVMDSWFYCELGVIFASLCIYAWFDSTLAREERTKLLADPNNLRVDMTAEKAREDKLQYLHYLVISALFASVVAFSFWRKF